MDWRSQADQIFKTHNLIWKLHNRKTYKKNWYKEKDGRVCKHFIWVPTKIIDWHDQCLIRIKWNKLQVKS